MICKQCGRGHDGDPRYCIARLQEDLEAKDAELAKARQEVERMKEHTWCAYCGHEIHIDDEAATKISEHIMTCEKHPIHIALAEIAALRTRCEEAVIVIRQIVNDLPSKRDWLNPDTENWARLILVENTKEVDHKR